MAHSLLFVDHAPAIGGAENSLLLLLTHLDRERWEPHLAGIGGPLLDRAAAQGIVTHQVNMPRLRRSLTFPVDWLRAARTLAHVADRIDAAVLYANTVRAAFYTAPAARLAGRPFIWHMRDFWLSETRPRYVWVDTALKRLLCAAATHIITNSHAVARHLPAGAPLTVAHNGIEVTTFDPTLDGTPFRRQFGIPVDAPLVGMVGRLRPWKGQDCFLRMAALVTRELLEAHFLVVGGEPFGVTDGYAQRLRCLATELGLDERVTFTGHLDEVQPALAAMNVFVHPGNPEPFGLVNVEAMAMGIPVVAFDHGALPEIVVDSETGCLIWPRDIEDMADTVTRLLRDTDRQREMGTAGHRRAEMHFDIRQTVRAIEGICDDIVSQNHP